MGRCLENAKRNPKGVRTQVPFYNLSCKGEHHLYIYTYIYEKYSMVLWLSQDPIHNAIHNIQIYVQCIHGIMH